MKLLKYTAGFIILAIVMTAFVNRKQENVSKSTQTSGGKGFVLLELFTSEGCSSCPAADELLAKIQKEAPDKPLYVLAYHVDYWDRLGWKDIFSSSEYSKRQSEYSQFLNTQQIYTPQVVINGKIECIGSNEPVLRSAIADALTTGPLASLTLQAQQTGDKLTINYEITGRSKTDRLLVAVVQKSATSKVERGENSGRILSHAQVVRELHIVTLTPGNKGSDIITLPPGFDQKNGEIIGFIQNKRTGEIVNATRAEFGK